MDAELERLCLARLGEAADPGGPVPCGEGPGGLRLRRDPGPEHVASPDPRPERTAAPGINRQSRRTAPAHGRSAAPAVVQDARRAGLPAPPVGWVFEIEEAGPKAPRLRTGRGDLGA